MYYCELKSKIFSLLLTNIKNRFIFAVYEEAKF